jgi:hypothetical protein
MMTGGGGGGGGGASGGGSSNPISSWLQQQSMPMGHLPQPQQSSSGYGGGADSLYQLMTMMGGLQEQDILKQAWDRQSQAANIAMNPGMMNARIGQFLQPMSKQLISGVTRATMPNVNMAGMGTSPGMATQMVSQALAPYQMQEQQQAQNMALGTLNVPFQMGAGAAGGYPSSFTELPYLMQLEANQAKMANNPYGYGGYGNPYGYGNRPWSGPHP